LQRHGISRLRNTGAEKPVRGKFEGDPLGYFHIDIAEAYTGQGKLYQFVAIDRILKFVLVEVHDNTRSL